MEPRPQNGSASATRPPSAWRGMFVDLPRQHGFEPARIEGTLPSELCGTLYRNGPSSYALNGNKFGHWFDGDGAVSAFRLAGGKAQTAVRYVRTEAMDAEAKAGKLLYRGYGTKPRNWLARIFAGQRHSANTSVIVWQDRVYALWEGGRPVELSREDLSTLGERDLDGVVGRTFSAHPHYVPERKAAYNFGVRYGPQTLLELYELPNAGPARKLGVVPLAGATMIHDFIATPRHLVFFAPPLRMHVPRWLLGIDSYSESLRWKPEAGTEVLVVALDDVSQVKRFTLESFYQWHFASAFERGDELVVDLVTYPDFRNNLWFAKIPYADPEGTIDGKLRRVTLGLKSGQSHIATVSPTVCEFPRVASGAQGVPYRFTYVASALTPESNRGVFDGISRIDVETGEVTSVSLGEQTFPSEPVAVRKAHGAREEDTWLLAPCFDARAQETFLAVLDGAALGQGPVARVRLGHILPPTFHGNWHAARANN